MLPAPCERGSIVWSHAMSHPSQTRRCALVKAVTFTASVVWSALPWTLRRACGSNLLENHKPSSANCDIMPVVLSVCENGAHPALSGYLKMPEEAVWWNFLFCLIPPCQLGRTHSDSCASTTLLAGPNKFLIMLADKLHGVGQEELKKLCLLRAMC